MIEKIFAQDPINLGNIGGGGLGPFGELGNTIGSGQAGGITALNSITGLVSTVIGVMTAAAGIWFIFMFLIGGYTWLSSMGDKKRLEEARDRIVNALIGLVIVIATFAITSLVGQFFGWDILLQRPGELFDSMGLPR